MSHHAKHGSGSVFLGNGLVDGTVGIKKLRSVQPNFRRFTMFKTLSVSIDDAKHQANNN